MSVTIQYNTLFMASHDIAIEYLGRAIYIVHTLSSLSMLVHPLEIRSNMSHQRQTISDFGLTRKLNENKLETTVYNFLTPFVGVPFHEAQLKVYEIYSSDDKKFLLKYAVSVAKATFLVINAQLVNEDTGARYTDMRLHKMILDSWIAESGSPTDLQFLCVWRITNEDTFEHMIDTYMIRYRSPCRGNQVTIRPEEGTAFHDNMFLRCGLSLVRELRSLYNENLEMKRAHYMKTGTDEDDLIFHIVMKLGKEDEEDGVEEEKVDCKPEPHLQQNSDSSDGGDEVIFRGRTASRRV